MNLKMVSVIMPTYKQDELFHQAVKSVLVQTYTNFELIIIDDNKDIDYKNKNEQFIVSLHDNRVHYLQNKNNIGSAKSRNKGIAYAKGDYITFLDDDDFYTPLKLEKQIEVMERTNCEASVCNLILTNEHGKIIDKRERKYFSGKESLLNLHLKYHITGTDTMMFQTEFLRKIGGFDEIDLGDEFYLMMKAIVNNAKIEHVDYDGVYGTVHNKSGLSGFKNKLKTEEQVYLFKQKYFTELTRKDIRFIRMRHYAVRAVAYKKGGKIFKFIGALIVSFFNTPIGFFKLYSGECR